MQPTVPSEQWKITMRRKRSGNRIDAPTKRQMFVENTDLTQTVKGKHAHKDQKEEFARTKGDL